MRVIDTVNIAGVATKAIVISHRNQKYLSLVFPPKEKRKMLSILN
tara:strand:+ start:2951 stop:3085 length:135 start_codon:yes stop_codon:yes gene_type:complete